MKIGYARVSTSEQNLDSQMQSLERAGCAAVFKEKISGAKKDRPELTKLLEQLRPGDCLIVCKLDRLARSTHHLLGIIETLRQKNCTFRSLGEPWADTTSHAGKMIMTVFAGIAEFERDLIRERTGTGRKLAMQRGVRFGRPNKLSKEQQQLAIELIQTDKTVSEVAEAFNVDRSTIYRLQEKQAIINAQMSK